MAPLLAAARAPVPELHARFARVHAAIAARARGTFRTVRCPHDRADLTADAALTAWRYFLRAVTERHTVDPVRLARLALGRIARGLRRRTRLALVGA